MPAKKAEETDTAEIASPKPCGHVNHHHYNTKGRLEVLTCDLDPKHSGDHHAKYTRNVAEPVHDEKGRVVKTTYTHEEADAYWTDAAGKPAADITEGEQVQMSLLQKDLVMEILKKEPNMTAREAIERAKANPAWNAVSF